jgi:hypothetical protein
MSPSATSATDPSPQAQVGNKSTEYKSGDPALAFKRELEFLSLFFSHFFFVGVVVMTSCTVVVRLIMLF